MRKTLLGLVVVSIAVAFVMNVSFAGKDKEKSQATQEQEEHMKQYLEATAPGAHHEAFKSRAGKWNAEIKIFGAPGTEPAVAKATSTYEVIMGGRFMTQRIEGEVMGSPFVGMGVSGFDKTSGKHTTYWFDNTGTQSVYSEGECSDHCMKEWYQTSITDAMTGQESKVKMVTKVISDDKHVFEWYQAGADGEMAKTMEIVYTRI